MADTTTFANAKNNSIGTSPVAVHTNSQTQPDVIIGLMIGNKTASVINVDLSISGIDILKSAAIPAGGALPVVDQGGKIPLENGEAITVTSDVADSATCLVGLMRGDS